MIFFVIIGAVLGGLSVVFVLENVTVITVTFLNYQITGSLALILFAAIMSGIVMTLLVLLPSFIRDEFRFSALKKQKKAVEDELVAYKQAAVAIPEIQTPII